MSTWFSVLPLTRSRVYAAFAIAVAVDTVQILLGPIGWAFSDQALDLVAMLLMVPLLGFHPLLLPTFVLELLPVADMLPSWTACTALLVAMRRREITHAPSAPPPIPGAGPIIDV